MDRRRRRSRSGPSTAAELADPVPTPGGGTADGSMGTALAGLYDDLTTDILSRVPLKDVVRAKCVAKHWRDLIAHPIHRKKLPQTLEGFFHGGGGGGGPERHSYGKFASLSGSGEGRVSPVDPSFSFLTAKLPGVKNTVLLDSCNGLLLFGCRQEDTFRYIVCNPATEELVTVPASSDSYRPASPFEETDLVDGRGRYAYTYLMFDPAVSSRFHLVQFWSNKCLGEVDAVCSYSSETRTWSSKWRRGQKGGEQGLWGKTMVKHMFGTALVNGLLHFIVERPGKRSNNQIVPQKKTNLIVAVDGEGEICRIIRWHDKHEAPFAFIGQSKGRLHCITPNLQHNDYNFTQYSVWVLKDYETQEWILKHSVSTSQLFGSPNCPINDFDIVAIHPDHHSIILVQHRNQKLVSYNTDSKELRVLCSLGEGYGVFTPYVPCFMESPVFATKGSS